jgi:uncharacterized membrane protein (DUF441 family)
MQGEFWVLAIIGLISVVAHNYSVAGAAGVLLLLRILGATRILDAIESYGLQAGILLLTISVLAPIASGKITILQIQNAFISPNGLLAIGVGIMVAIFGGYGTVLLQTTPQMITAIVVGTIMGVAFFKGVAVGPLIAAGIIAVIMEAVKFIQQ